MKKMMLLALAVASVAMFALPAVASAGSWHAEGASDFVGTGGTSELTTTAGNRVHCTGLIIDGKYETTTTGKVEFTFTGCKGPLGVSCTSSGQSSGTITTTELPFHNVQLEPNGAKPGVLITPNPVDNVPTAGFGHFATFGCFGITTIVKGNGLLGEVTAPKCGDTSTSMTWIFARASQGHQKWTQITTAGTNYDLKMKVGTSEWSTASLDGSGTVIHDEMKMDCTSIA